MRPSPNIKLTTNDWLWATWRPHKPKKRPPVRPFNQKNACQQVIQLWHNKLKLPPTLSPPEAHFWLVAMKKISSHHTHQKLVAELAHETVDGQLTADKIGRSLLPHNYHYRYPFAKVIIPLMNLLTWTELIQLISRWEAQLPHVMLKLADGFQTYALPYLTPSEKEEIRQAVDQTMLTPWFQFQPQWQTTPQTSTTVLLFIAALVGGFDKQLTHYLESTKPQQSYYRGTKEVIWGLSSPTAVQQHIRQKQLWLTTSQEARAWLAHTELEGLDWIYESIIRATNRQTAEQLFRVLARVQDPAAVPYILQLRTHSHTSRLANEWLHKFPSLTAAGLLPLALSPSPHPLQEAALTYLRLMKTRGDKAVLQTAAASLSLDTNQEITLHKHILTWEENTFPLLTEAPKWLQTAVVQIQAQKRLQKPNWIDYVELPPLLIGKKGLTPEQGNAFLKALKHSTLTSPHSLVTQIKQHAAASHLASWVWQLFQKWLEMGAPTKEKWAFLAVGILGDDTSVMKLTPLICKWPGQSRHQRAVLGLKVMRAIGTDTALMQINGIGQKIKFKGLKREAQQAIQAIAQERQMTPEALADRIVPTCGLDHKGQRLFDYGPRRFTFVLNADMKPMVRDETGKIRANLPPPGKRDEAQLAAAAFADWKLIKKQVREVAKWQAVRLEQALVTERRWSVPDFERFLVQHPLTINLVKLLLWGGYDDRGHLQQTFRVTDEQDYANIEDEAITLTNNQITQIGLVHPLHLVPEDKAAWGELFSDYELIAPFPQLGRETYGLHQEEMDQVEITRFDQVKINPGALVSTLENLGWQRGVAQDGGVFFEHAKPFAAANLTAVVEYDGVPMGIIYDWEDQTIKRCRFFAKVIPHTTGYPATKGHMRLNKVDPIALSEVLRDLHIVAAKGA